MPVEELLPCSMGKWGHQSEWQGQTFYRKLINSRFRTWKSYYFDLMSTVKINKCNKTANTNVKKPSVWNCL